LDWLDSIQCWVAGDPTRRFLVKQMWWKQKKK
jgi:hypothetical protein